MEREVTQSQKKEIEHTERNVTKWNVNGWNISIRRIEVPKAVCSFFHNLEKEQKIEIL